MTGDGLLATFDGPARAVRCAAEIRSRLKGLGLDVRIGLHTGEVELLEGDVGGIGVHIAARVMAEARSHQIVATGTVKDLVVGSEIEFAERGSRELRGVPGEWRLFEALV
jgi:class 3 adenylate cyclase